jgi:V8-like Glu-specific endopeptidase
VVTDREPLKFRKSGQVARGTELVVIGHPSGLPTKISDGAQVRSSNRKYFVANLDTYGGNSGSAVFDARTGEVQGILVRGEEDYVSDPAGGNCQATNYCPDTGCRGEDVTHITNVPNLKRSASK